MCITVVSLCFFSIKYSVLLLALIIIVFGSVFYYLWVSSSRQDSQNMPDLPDTKGKGKYVNFNGQMAYVGPAPEDYRPFYEGLKDNSSKPKDFIAIDFETSTVKYQLPCQIGLTFVEGGKIVKSLSQYIQPPGNKYSPQCVRVHGITPDMTADAPDFRYVWDALKGLFEGAFLVAHNASFDMSVLDKTLYAYSLTPPRIKGYACTCEIFEKARLEDACEAFGINLDNAHDAKADAEACARLYLAHINGEKPLRPIVHTPVPKRSKARPVGLEGHEAIHGDLLEKDLTHADPSNPFYDKKVVITGVFRQERGNIAKWLKRMGADINRAISGRTQIVLIGEDAGPKKLEKIAELREQGKDILVYGQKELDEIIKQYGWL